jgi:hypothetical protein
MNLRVTCIDKWLLPSPPASAHTHCLIFFLKNRSALRLNRGTRIIRIPFYFASGLLIQPLTCFILYCLPQGLPQQRRALYAPIHPCKPLILLIFRKDKNSANEHQDDAYSPPFAELFANLLSKARYNHTAGADNPYRIANANNPCS